MNSNLDISVLISTRPRYPGPLLYNLERAKSLTCSLDNVEFLLKIDHDDLGTRNVVDKFIEKSGMPIRYIIMDGLKKRYGIDDYTNLLAWNAKGNLLWYWSDELSMYTQDWNIKAGVYAQKYVNIPMVLMARNHTNPLGYCFAPAISRKWLEITGRFCYHTCIDSYLELVAGPLRQNNIGTHNVVSYVMSNIIVEELSIDKMQKFDRDITPSPIITTRAEAKIADVYLQHAIDPRLELNHNWTKDLFQETFEDIASKFYQYPIKKT